MTKEIPYLEGKVLKEFFPGIPLSFLPKKLKAFGYAKFKGDNFTGAMADWSVNDKFVKGKDYPVFNFEGDHFVIGEDKKAYKKAPTVGWTKIKLY